MRSWIAVPILLLLAACEGKKLKPAVKEIDVPHSTGYTFRGFEKAPQKDSIALIKAFNKFCLALNDEDGFLLSSMSTGNKYFPLSLTGMLQLPPGLPDFLISRPIKKLYKADIWNAIQTTQPVVYARTDLYELSYLIKHTANNKKVERMYRFEFVKEGNEFKFSQFESTTDCNFFDIVLDSMTWYFPPGNYAENRQGDVLHLNKFSNIWYSQTLKICEEPVLYNYKGSEEIYRFTWLRSFHLPVVFRFQKQGFNFMLTTKVLLERYDEYTDELETNQTTSVSFFKWYIFKSRLADAAFWNLQLNDNTAQPNDGSIWIVEGFKDGKYHMVERWSPGHNLREACLYLLSISGLKIPKRAIY